MRHTRGMSLLELLITLAIAAVLFAIAATSLPSDRFAVNQAARGFAEQMSRARLEALRANSFAGLRVDLSGDGAYSVCIDANDDRACSDAETVQNVAMGVGTNGQVRLASSAFDLFLFDPRGVPYSASAGDVVFANAAGTHSVTVSVSAAGSAEVQ